MLDLLLMLGFEIIQASSLGKLAIETLNHRGRHRLQDNVLAFYDTLSTVPAARPRASRMSLGTTTCPLEDNFTKVILPPFSLLHPGIV